jgi:hypothetical protein
MGAIVTNQTNGDVTKSKNQITNRLGVASRSIKKTFGKGKQGFTTLSEASSSYNVPSPSLDFMSELPSSGSCVSTYSNSRGYICLDKKAVQLLTTRGGNMSTGEAQIG